MRALFIIIFVSIIFSACTSENNFVAQGKVLFNKKHIGKNKVIGCVSCHSVNPGQIIIGPSLAGLKLRAPYLVEGESAKEYIRNSIINPDAYIVNGFLPAIMFPHYSQELSKEELLALIAYLSQL